MQTQPIVNYQWVEVTGKAEFAPRDGAGALVFKNRIWLIGGWNPKDKVHFPRICNNEVWSSADGMTWIQEKPNTFSYDGKSFNRYLDWEGRHYAGYVVFGNKMWIIGGDPNQGHYHYDVWNSADGKKWDYVNSAANVPWGPRFGILSLVFSNKIWIMGGQTMPQFAPAEERFHGDIWHTTDGINWEKVIPRKPYWSPRGFVGGSVVFNNRMWILGGGTYATPMTPQRKYFNDVWNSADGVNWECNLEQAPWSPRAMHEVAVFDDKMWVMEGTTGANRNDVWYSSDGVNWHELPGTPWKPRHAASVFVHDDALWMVAGNNMESDVWKLRRI